MIKSIKVLFVINDKIEWMHSTDIHTHTVIRSQWQWVHIATTTLSFCNTILELVQVLHNCRKTFSMKYTVWVKKKGNPDLISNLRKKKIRITKLGSMTYAPTTNAPARNANVEAYINPDPNPNPYPALNQKPNHTHESNSVFGEVSMPEQLSPEHMSCHPKLITGNDSTIISLSYDTLVTHIG